NISWSHPTSFQGSKGVMGYHSPQLSHIQLNYSWKYWWATGLHYIRQPDPTTKKEATLASLNFLIYRWNTKDLQANIYTVLGGGESHFTGQQENVGYAMGQFDIEDRNYYFLAKHLQMGHSPITHLRQTVFRGGFSPYIDPFDGFHTWLILEWRKTEVLNAKVGEGLIPFLRFFYRNILFEVGYSLDGQALFNYITHF
ncbi:MAG: hypothetical protein KDD58_10070, partial [Bdellovibrionales bacterium]|nr:hypothetical protein [Bdellovibrionales bacterium]